ncbi:MAG: branched chain amino acid aminotransferase [Spirochaetes bacterium GWF1_41_5]|nr:MAG: branched chain amino acid aminotransferase [Spirochaetes bacterium GWF1_41_5]HBE04327.1 branched chain amino acid aminotransferase [Spirochaetia bacterium]
MPFYADKIWFDGEFVAWNDAKIHVLSHVIHYGSGAFEGLRAYENKNGTAVFRMHDHTKRLLDSCKIYRFGLKLSDEQINQAILDTIRINRLKSAYIRPLVFRGYSQLGVNPFNCPVQMIIAAWDWGKYLGDEALEKGISVCISSWQRVAPNTFPALAKVSGNYMNSQLIKMEAIENGYDEGIALDANGFISEGSGENVFMVKNGVIFTPPSNCSILAGITRHCVFILARDLGLTVKQHVLPRESLYIADEVFLTGTAAEITPVTKIDKISVSGGRRGPITEKIQKAFFSIITGESPDKNNWLSYI